MYIFYFFCREKSYNASTQIQRGIKTFFAIFLFALISLSICSCSKNDIAAISAEISSEAEVQTPEARTAYFVFEGNSIRAFKSFDDLPAPNFYAWTEACRASGVSIYSSPAIFLINKCGILHFDKSLNPQLNVFPNFTHFTAEDFFNTSEGLLFHSFRNSLFAETPAADTDEATVFLYRYNPVTETIAAYATSADLSLPTAAQCSHLQNHRGTYLASFKTDTGSKIYFDFFRFQNIDDIKNKNYKNISKSEFQNAAVPETLICAKSYENTTKNLLSLLGEKYRLCENKILTVCVNSQSVSSKYVYALQNAGRNSAEHVTEAEGQAICNESDLYLLLADGSFYGIKKVEDAPFEFFDMRLPKLPEAFVYTVFSVEKDRTTNKTMLLAFWEERKFFQVGRSGFIKMPAKGLEPLRSCPQ